MSETDTFASVNKPELLPVWFIKYRRPAFSIFANLAVCVLAILFTAKGKDNNENWIAYLLAFFVAVITLPIEWAVDRRNPELTKDLRFDLAGAMVALAIMRVEATRNARQLYFVKSANAIALDVYFFLIFLGAKLVGRCGSREIAMLVMADIVDFIELTFAIQDEQTGYCGVSNGGAKCAPKATRDAIVGFTFIFTLVTLLLQRAEGPGQKALNALVQGVFVHLPIVCLRLSIPINEGGMPSFNAVFIAKNIVELIGCAYDFLEAGSQVKAGTSSYDAV
jgi:hypothetical protein